jgi:hypothetical protein
MRVHHSHGLKRWLPAMLLRIWREWQEGESVQLQLSLENISDAGSDSFAVAFSKFRAARAIANPDGLLTIDDSDRSM